MSACIWYVSKYVALPNDRVGTRSFMLMRELARLGHRAVVLTSDSNHLVNRAPVTGSHERRVVDGVEVCWVRTVKYKGAKSLGRILSWFDFEWRLSRLPENELPRPDVVVVSSLSLLTIFNGLRLRQRHGCRLIFEVRDIWPLTIIEEGGYSPRNPLVAALAMVERLAYRRSDAIVGTMPNLVEHVTEVAGAEAAPVHCIPMGFDERELGTADPLPLGYAEAHIPQGRFLVCHAGTIGITNALDTLLDCARAMRDRDEIHFLILGDGDLKSSYERKCADLRNVSFAPVVPKSMVQSVLQRCDLLYFSAHVSRVWKYGQSLNKVIDYMLAGKPIVASFSGYPSMIDESGGGSFVPAGDVETLESEIERYAAMSVEQRSAIGVAAREWLVRNRTYARLATEYLKIMLPDRAAT